ncbi:unnamed protein product [Closterium sp. Naga37s-1]|nr:unnamed protein product [Closterium sp. Naga37s-1]
MPYSQIQVYEKWDEVYEARDGVVGEGTLITLYPNGLRALSRIVPAIVPQACASDLISPGVPDPTILGRSPTGDLPFQWDLGSNMTAWFGFPLLNIRWQEVLDLLRGMLPNDAVHAGHRLVGFTQGEEEKEGGGGAEGSGSVKCVFKEVSGGEERLLEVETATATTLCLVIPLSTALHPSFCSLPYHPPIPFAAGVGRHSLRDSTPPLLEADGIHSEARKQLLAGTAGGGVSPRDNGRTHWRAIIDSSLCTHPVCAPFESTQKLLVATAGEGVSVRDNGRTHWRAIIDSSLCPHPVNTILCADRTATAADAGAGRLYWSLALVDSADPTVSNEPSSGGEEAREKILQAFEGWDAVEQLVHATSPELIRESRVLDLPPLPFWVHGRVALMGDKEKDGEEGKEGKEGEEGKEENSAGSDESEAKAAPKIEEVQAASAAVAAREGRDPDEELYGYDIVVLE